MSGKSDEYQVSVERDGDFTYVEVKEDGRRVAYYTIENEYAPGVVTALRALQGRDEEPLFATHADCLWPEHCQSCGRCALGCDGSLGHGE